MATQRRKDNKNRVLREGEYQRANGTYRYRWLDKRHKEHNIYAKTLEELRAEEDKIQRDTLDGIDTDCKLSLNDVYERWKRVKRGLKDNTFQNYTYMYEAFVMPSFGKAMIADIKKSDVRAFYNYLKEDRALGIPSIDNIHTVMHQVFDLAAEDELIRVNPSDGALKELKRTHKEEPVEVRSLTFKEQAVFENILATNPKFKRWHPLYTTMLLTGMRVGEISGLRWCDIDFEKKLISVNHTLVYYNKGKLRGGCAYAINTPKTKAGCRLIPMMPEVVEALKEEKEYQELEGLKCNSTIDGYTDFVFLNRFGDVYNQSALNRALDRIERDWNVKAADIKDAIPLPPLTNHWLRHTFATRMVEAGVLPKALQEIMGHKDIATTMNYYASASEDFTAEEIEKYRVMVKRKSALIEEVLPTPYQRFTNVDEKVAVSCG